MSGQYILGVDVGTTSVKVCLLNVVTKEVFLKDVKDTLAAIPSDMDADGDEQSVAKIYSALHSCISKISKDILRKVVHVAFCGQVHGVVFWKSREAWQQNAKGQLIVGPSEYVSSLYTWQDGRCSQEFLSSLPVPSSHLSISSGYGCATTFWMLEKNPEFLAQFDRCGTVMDFLISMILDLTEPVTSDQNAASFGYFDSISMNWNYKVLEEANFPTGMLPKVVKSTENAGLLPQDWFDIPAGTPVSAAMGDLQCSVKSTLENINMDVVLNVSTSAQMAFATPEGFQPQHIQSIESRSPVEYFPYLEGRYLAVAASLNGGNTLATFIKMIQSWCVELGVNVPQSKIWDTTLSAGVIDQSQPTLKIVPTIFGERHSPYQKGSVENITQGNIGLGQVTKAVCRGIVANLAEMMTPDILRQEGKHRIVGSGACLIRNPVLQGEIQDIYQLPVSFVEEGNACIGAAMAVADRSMKI